MYWYFPLFIIIFLTHPGVILNPFKESAIISAFYQVFWVWILNLPSNGSAALYYSTSVIYYWVFLIWAYLKFQMERAKISLSM